MGSLTARPTSSPWLTLGSATSSSVILLVRQAMTFRTGAEFLASLSMESVNPLRRVSLTSRRRLGRRRPSGSTAGRSLSPMSMASLSLQGRRRTPMSTSRAQTALRTNSSALSRERRPRDREEEDEDHPAAELKGFTKMLTGMAEGPIPGMQVLRVPLVEEKALPESALDVIVNALKGENPATTQCIF